jgi:transposase
MPVDNPKPKTPCHLWRNFIMSEPCPTGQHFIGCDVSKDTIAVFVGTTRIALTLSNKAAALKAWCKTLPPDTLVICETTGGYETALLEACLEAGVPAHRANARQVKAFIASLGTRAKTDAVDARALAEYGAQRNATLQLWQPADPAAAELFSLVQRRREVVGLRTQEKNRKQAPGSKAIQGYIADLLQAYDRQIKQLDQAIKALVRKNKTLADRIAKASAIKGVGLTTATTVIALMPELGTLTRRQAASLAGLAPHPRQSGTRDGYRPTTGGRQGVKSALFMAAIVAVRHNSHLKPFYERLIKNGKKPIVAITAAMRKLITSLNAELRPKKHTQMS